MIQTIEYNEKQCAAINAPEDKVVVTAPAGSGKSRSIVGAVDKYFGEHPLDHIVVVTFTKKAAAELQERIATLNTEISTIHSWSYRRLQDFAIKYNFTIDLLDDENIKEILKRIAKYKRFFYLNQFQLFAYVMGQYNIDVDEKMKYAMEQVRLSYIQFKRDNGLYDFTDLPQYLLDVMNEYEEDVTGIDALFVDEFQDIDPVQLEIFNRTRAKKKMYIGDVRQSIYLFRGSTQEIFNKLVNFTEYKLDINYRSYQEIVNYAISINNNATQALRDDKNDYDFVGDTSINLDNKDVVCSRGNGAIIRIIDDYGSCVDPISDTPCSPELTIKELLADKHTQILCRSNRQVKKIQGYGYTNVSTVHQAKGLEYDNVILTDFPITSEEEKNIAYVGMTRAKNKLCTIRFDILSYIICSEGLVKDNKLF